MSKKKMKKVPSMDELARTVRRDWNGIKPISRIQESKKNKPIKHKKKELEEASET